MGVRSQAARTRPLVPHPPSVQRDAEHGGKASPSRSAAGWPTASTTRSRSRSRMRRCCPTARTATCAAAGSSASSITTASRSAASTIRAASRPGCAWAKRSGLSARRGQDQRHVIPAVRFAVDAYVNFARRAPWQEAVCSSLTELFAPEIHKQRLATWPEHYRWIDAQGLQLLPQPRQPGAARRGTGLAITLDSLRTRENNRNARIGGAAVQARHPVGDERRDGAGSTA